MSLRGFATLNIWADDVTAAAAWYAEFLGMEPYFSRPGPDGRPAYIEFRIGDAADELGIIDRRYAPPGAATEPGGAIMHWHVDDLEGTVQRLLALGATEYEPITPRGDGVRHGLGGGPVRQRARGDVQPALRRDGRALPGRRER